MVIDRAARDRVARDRAVDVLVILDGASEPLGDAPTSLERARTPVLDRLAAEGTVTLLHTVPPGLPAGSETAIPGLLGWVPDAPVDRGAIEAAAHGIEVGDGERARRVDRRDRADASATAHVLARVLDERLPRRRGAPRHRVHHLEGHRMLIVGPDPAPTLGGELLGMELRAGMLRGERLGDELFVWPAGVIPPRTLDASTVMIGAPGAAIGIARLMGARTIVPAGATGRPGSDLAAKAAAALAAIGDDRAGRVVVHVGAPGRGRARARRRREGGRDRGGRSRCCSRRSRMRCARAAARCACARTMAAIRRRASTTTRRCRAWTGRRRRTRRAARLTERARGPRGRLEPAAVRRG